MTVTLTTEQAEVLLAALDTGLDAAMQVAQEYHDAMKGYRPHRHKEVDDDAHRISAAITMLGQLMEEPEDSPQ